MVLLFGKGLKQKIPMTFHNKMHHNITGLHPLISNKESAAEDFESIQVFFSEKGEGASLLAYISQYLNEPT